MLCYNPALVSEQRGCSVANNSMEDCNNDLTDASACMGQDDAAPASKKQEEPRPEKHEGSTG
jgi:hypothetical protein